MSPRPYQLGQRQAAVEETRARVLTAARELLGAPGGVAGFSVEAVARQANVARMTVYYQFGSKRRLLEALFDELAARGQMERLASTFSRSEPFEALDAFIAVFGHFWSVDRLVMRRLRCLAALDPDFEQAVQARDHWRRGGLRVILGRLAAQSGHPSPEALDDAIATLEALTSFEFFDQLAGAERSPEQVTSTVQQLARATFGLAHD